MPRANIPASDASFQPATASWRIEVSNSALPLIEAPVVIDGYTQPGASANTLTPREGGLSTLLKIELSLSNGNGFSGLEIPASFPVQGASTIRGLAISRFINQIVLTGTAAHRIESVFWAPTSAARSQLPLRLKAAGCSALAMVPVSSVAAPRPRA